MGLGGMLRSPVEKRGHTSMKAAAPRHQDAAWAYERGCLCSVDQLARSVLHVTGLNVCLPSFQIQLSGPSRVHARCISQHRCTSRCAGPTPVIRNTACAAASHAHLQGLTETLRRL